MEGNQSRPLQINNQEKVSVTCTWHVRNKDKNCGGNCQLEIKRVWWTRTLTCEDVMTVMPMLVAILYKCSSTSTLVALQRVLFLSTALFVHHKWNENKKNIETYLVHSSRMPYLGQWKNKRAWKESSYLNRQKFVLRQIILVQRHRS
jgi:hypothetical protein